MTTKDDNENRTVLDRKLLKIFQNIFSKVVVGVSKLLEMYILYAFAYMYVYKIMYTVHSIIYSCT